MTEISRRSALAGLSSAGLIALGAQPSFGASLVSKRATLPSGIQAGDVTTRTATVWARSSAPGRLVAEVAREGRKATRRITGPWATPANDFTAKLDLSGLAPGTDYTCRIHFEDSAGVIGERQDGHFRTAAAAAAATSFVWTGDTAGQGWGINPDLGGMKAYAAMHELRPDFLIHSGDNIYADSPITEKVVEPDGKVWRNVVTEEVAKVAETLKEFRGRYRYNQMDQNIRAMYADVPVISQWDDHETTNNWYPGEILEDERYKQERRVDVLAARARQAFFENMPISDVNGLSRRERGGTPVMYRKLARGKHLDVFSLDMRSYKGPNTAGLETHRTAFLGQQQVDWLLAGLTASKATWKVIAADMPIGIIVPDGPNGIEAIANGRPGAPLGRELEIAYLLREIKERGITNVVWFTADVHYCSTHFYDPGKAAFSEFSPFYEFVSGPISAGGFGPNDMDSTFGPQILFQDVPDYVNQSPRALYKMFFGYTQIDLDGTMTVQHRDGYGKVLHSTVLEPQRRGSS